MHILENDYYQKKSLGRPLYLHVASVLISAVFALETVVEKKKKTLPGDTGPMWHPDYHSLPSPGFRKDPIIKNLEMEDAHRLLGSGLEAGPADSYLP